MDYDSIVNISIRSEDENVLEDSGSDKLFSECSVENSEYGSAQSESSQKTPSESDKVEIEDHPNVLCRHIYTRDQLVECSFSLICLQPPPNWEITERKMPEIVLKERRKIPNVQSLQLHVRPWRMQNSAKRNEFAWKNAYMADCCLVVGEEKKEFLCHKYILCLASSVLEDAVKDAEENQQIMLPHISTLNFHKVLEYIYTDNIKKKSLAIIQDVWITAHKLGIISLEHYCVTCARQKVCITNVCSTLQFARLIKDEGFELYCVQYIQENIAKVLQATKWSKIERRTLETILGLEIVHDTCESDLFKVCVLWANENTPPDGNKRDTLGPLIGLIRFLTFKVETFALTVCPTKLLTPEEMVAIFCCLATGARDMPAGFSIESSPRDRVVSLDMFQTSTSNVNGNTCDCTLEVPSLVQTEHVEFRENALTESLSAVGNDKLDEVSLYQEVTPPILPTEIFLGEMGKTDVITLPFGDNRNALIRNGGQIMQSPLAFLVSSMSYIVGVDLISWRTEDECPYYENLQVTLKALDKPKVFAKFEGFLKRLQRFQVNFDNPVCVFPNSIYKLNVIYSDPSIKHSSYLLSPQKKKFGTSWGTNLTITSTGNYYTNIRAICVGQMLQYNA